MRQARARRGKSAGNQVRAGGGDAGPTLGGLPGRRGARGVLDRMARGLATAAALLVPAAGGAADWPQWQGPSRNGLTPEAIASWPPRRLWSAQVGRGYSSIVVAAGRAYALGHEPREETPGRGFDRVVCLDARTGDVLWRQSYDCLTSRRDSTAGYDGPRATPAVADGAVYTLSLEGHLHCFDAETGRILWSKDLVKELGGAIPFYGYCCSPLVSGGKVVVELNAPNGGSYAAFEAATGRLLWKAGSNSASTASPALARAGGKELVLFVSDNVLAAHDLASGEEVWKTSLKWTTWMGPVADGELVFASSASLARGCAVFRIGEKVPLWEGKTTYQALHCNTVLWEGSLYGSDNTRTDYQYSDNARSSLKCIDFRTGEVHWTLKGMGWANVIVARDRLLVLRESGELVLMKVSPSGYEELGRAKALDGPCWTIPAISGGRIYCRSNRGEVVCLEAGPG